MPSEVAQAYLTLRAKTNQLQADMAQGRGVAVSGMTNIVSGVSAAGVGLGAALGGGFSLLAGLMSQAQSAVSGWVNDAAQKEVLQAQYNRTLAAAGPIIGYNRQQMAAMASEVANMSAFSEGAARGAQQMLMRFSEVRGDQFHEAQLAAADLASAMGQELPQAAQRLGMALQNPVHGMQMLRREGITLSEQQKELIRSTSDLETQQKLLLQFIRSNPVVAGAAATFRNSFAGQAQIVQNQWKGAMTSIGEALIPAFRAVLPYTTALAAAIKDNKDIIQEIGLGIAGWLTPLMGAITATISWFGKLSPETKSWISSLGQAAVMAGAVAAAIAVGMPVIGTILGFVGSLLSPMGIVVGLVVAIASAIKRIIDTPELYNQVVDAWNKLSSVITDAWNALTGAVHAGEGFDVIGWLAEQLVDWFVQLADWVSQNRDGFVAFAEGVGEGITNIIFFVQNLGIYWKIVWNQIKLSFVSTWDFMTDLVKTSIAGWIGIFRALGSVIEQAFAGSIPSLERALQEGAVAAQQFLRDNPLGPSALQRDLQRESTQLADELRRRRADFDNASRQAAAPPSAAGARPAVDMRSTPQAREAPELKFEFSGFADAWKALQQSLTGGSMLSLTQGINTNTRNAVEAQNQANQTLNSIDRQVGQNRVAVVAPG